VNRLSTSPLVLNMAAFRGMITPSVAASRGDDGAQLTRRNGVQTQLDRSYSISLVGRVG